MCVMNAKEIKAAINRALGLESDRNGAGTGAGEEWVWVTGYKGMNKDMQCLSEFQYELGKRYDMPEGEKVELCESGFHLCLNLEHVFHYYGVGDNNRFFEVRALVRKQDKETYGGWLEARTKIVAKSIEIVRELTVDEVLAPTRACDWDTKYKELALSIGIPEADITMMSDELVNNYGYSVPFAQWAIRHGRYEIAKAVGSVEDLSVDTKVFWIMNDPSSQTTKVTYQRV